MKPLAAIFALTVFSVAAFAEGKYQNEEELRLVEAVSVYIQDEVRDGCLRNPNALKAEAELIMRRSGIPVIDSEQAYQLEIYPLGWEGKTVNGQPLGYCVVSLNLALWRWASVAEGHMAVVIAYDVRQLIAGVPKVDTQETLRTSVSEIVTDLANEILKARGAVR